MTFFAKALLLIVASSSSAFAATDQCPLIDGKFFCAAVAGSHEDMEMTITHQLLDDGTINYLYEYAQKGQAPYTLSFLASNEGTANPSRGGMIGSCWNGYYFNSKAGQLSEKTLLNWVNANGDYEVLHAKDMSLFLNCEKVVPVVTPLRPSFQEASPSS